MTINKQIVEVLKINAKNFNEEKLSKAKKEAIKNLKENGYEIEENHSWGKSLMITNPLTKKSLVVSKDYNKKTWIFNPTTPITEDYRLTYADILEKFDFENFLNKPSKKYNSEKNTKVQEYKKLSSNKNTYERISISYLEDIEKLKKELEKAEKSLEYYQESIKKEEEEIKNLFK